MSLELFRLSSGIWLSLQGGSPVIPPSPGTVFGVNAGNDANDAFAKRLGEFGRVPMARIYYPIDKLGGSSYLFNMNKEGSAPEKRSQVSFKVLPANILSGSWDARITNYVQSIPADHEMLLTYWHEPNSELNSGTFTSTQFKNAWYRISDLCVAAGVVGDGRVICAPNFTGPYPQAGVAWNRSWIPTVGLMHAGARLTWDAYGNPYGGGAYDAPYQLPSEPVNHCLTENTATGWTEWGITEFNTPRRNFDLNEVQRAQWIRDYVDYCMGLANPPKNILLWEGVGVQFDQRFKTQLTVDTWADITSSQTI